MALFAAVTMCGLPASAAADPSDAAATHAYLIAQYRLVVAVLHEAAAAHRAESAATAQIARECRGVVSGVPQPTLKRIVEFTPRQKGENARLSRQQQTISLELDAALARADDSVYRQADEAYAAEVRQLSWSNPAIAAELQMQTAVKLENDSTPAPPFCADARAWAQSGFRVLPAASREFEASQEARRRAELGEELSLDSLLKPYENASDRALIRRTEGLDLELLASGYFQGFSHLERIVGFPHAGPEEPRPVTVGHGRTAAGTRFEVSAGRRSGIGSCHRSATVAYTRPGSPEVLIVGGPNNPICLSPPRYRHPEVFCEAGLETFESAVPASVRSVRLVLADGRAIESRVVLVPKRDGGPSGVYAQQVRGSTSHAVSLVELNAGAEVVLALKLPRYRCRKPRNGSESGFPNVAELAAGHTPEGEPFRIGAYGEFNGQPFLGVDTGVDPELDETPAFEPGKAKAFPWSLKVGCAPHPYAILYGILAPPGTSVMARTPQGTVALNVVPVEPRLHAKGPLVYGVFEALPSELVVYGAGDQALYTENLTTQTQEEAQFCEGYVEP
ncbi:MAG TPA: hypothetical protein VGY13_11035 [Solirubrobacteraceae bacterium]|nr:hypothetical protein [Solirubrobacteraceae bacterium]